MENKTKKILVIGSYDKNYPRNKVLLKAFDDLFNIFEINICKGGIKKYFVFLKKAFYGCRDKNYIFLMNELSFRPAFFLFFIKIFF
ncbi:MAG: hypothetical protein U9M94_00610, partial [Patescibacteria group bacterium]|nr:hypothetical protein [Patescibacteria group bacterium]